MTWSTLLERAAQWDAALSRRLRIAERPGVLRTLAAACAHSGDSWLWFAGLGGVWLWGSAPWKARAAVGIVAVFVTATLVMGAKFTIRRQRPAGDWGHIYRKTDPHSFPSGHAARAFLLAVLAWGMGPPWLAWLLTLWAPLVALARVAMGVHYLSDVLAGLLVGVAMGGVVLAVVL